MKKKSSKPSIPPSPEAKALSLFLMAYKSKNPTYKEQSKRINRLWDQVRMGELRKDDYQEEIEKVLSSYGGYTEVVEKTVRFYVETTGEWKLKGEDKYCRDALKVVDRISKE